MTTPTSDENLPQRLLDELPDPLRRALQGCIDICEQQGLALDLVGGAVRDLLLRRNGVDLDLAIEGDTAPVAEELAHRMGGRAIKHERFGTATVKGPGFSLDLARTRSETYERPGALPDVAPASLTDDLRRRDFSINAMALRLTSPAGEIIDPFGGQSDLEARKLRVLHEASFKDDATRMLRAMRYAARLNFTFDAETEGWLYRDLSYVDLISPARVRRELVLLFEEPSAPRGALLADMHGVLRAAHPALSIDENLAMGWAEAMLEEHHAPRDELGFCLVARPASGEVVDSLSARLHLAGRYESALREFVRLRGLFAKLASVRDDPFAAVELLDGKAHAAIWALSIIDEGAAGQTCGRYLDVWRRVRPRLNGNDLLKLGVKQGTQIGDTLRMLRKARLEGRAPRREDEIRLVQQDRREG